MTTRPTSTVRTPLRPISVASLEVVIGRAVAVFGLLFGAQALPLALAQAEQLDTAWWFASVAGIYGALIAMLVTAVVKRGRVATTAVLSIVFMLALVLWPLGVSGGEWSAAERPWLWFLITVATAAAAVAFPVWLATVYLFVAPMLYGLLRLTVFGGSADLVITLLDVAFAVLLGGAVLVIITMLRSAAAAVDAAQATALSRYLDAVGEHAREVERVQVDAIVHDTVLSALLSAGRARTDEHRAQATMLAQNGIVHLKAADAAPPDDETVVYARMVAQRIAQVQSNMRTPFELDTAEVGDAVLTPLVAESLYAAALQAMVNSAQHAGRGDGVRRWVSMRRRTDGGIRVEIGDSGVGFSPAEIPEGRLGVRVSIVERMLLAGGEAHIESSTGVGTRVVLEWPAANAAADTGPDFAGFDGVPRDDGAGR